MKITTLDTTLRDGAGSSRVSFSNADKLKIAHLLDMLGVDLIEVGNPAYNSKNAAFFEALPSLSLQHAHIAVFGSTCHPGTAAANDEALLAMANCGARDAVLFGKAWDLHVTDVLKTSLEENLSIIGDSIRFLRAHDMRVIFDAEHFFDGYKKNPAYAIAVLSAAEAAGADTLVLCDTCGGCFPDEIFQITSLVAEKMQSTIGIHAHNDSGFAVSNTVLAAAAGARHVQGTINGVGERCGNANLATVIANLQLKRGYSMIPAENMRKLTPISRAVADISNISVRNLPYVSAEAFSHKAGMHIDGVIKNNESFEHIPPEAVGNRRHLLVSDIAGRSAVCHVLERILPGVPRDDAAVERILSRLKTLEYEGYQFDGADASFELVVRRELGLYHPHFSIVLCRLFNEHDRGRESSYSSVLIKVNVDGREEITAADADGPVHAVDIALRKALEPFFPSLSNVRLTDYKVRILNSEATGSLTRVLMESADTEKSWTTVGVSKDIIEASLAALVDSIEYTLAHKPD
ncbi:MAG: citramalate synthase [Clostridia bacterium]|nr:citramalate synthase [Clostridia bacterium]